MTRTARRRGARGTAVTDGRADDLLLGEWACLGMLCAAPSHGFALAARLASTADVGRIWSVSRPLTYRALEQLATRGLIAPAGEEPGIAGGVRTVFAATAVGTAMFRTWLATPVEHVRDLRSELLLKISLAGMNEIDATAMLSEQRERLRAFAASLDLAADRSDIVQRWRYQSVLAAVRFLEGLI